MTTTALGAHGVHLGIDLLSGGGPFAFDPFDAYRAGAITNPNMLVAGEPGVGKSATAKIFIYRSVGVFARWAAIADPKGEYGALAEALGLSVIKLHPGGSTRLNPLDSGPFRRTASTDDLAIRNAAMIAALLGAVLRRDLSPIEDAALGWVTTTLARSTEVSAPTLADVATLLANPTDEMATLARVAPAELAQRVEPAIYGLGKLLDRSLRGMFDGPTSLHIDWNAPGIVLDLSAIHHDADALTLVMIATTAWLQAILADPDGPPRLQILDEAWSLLASERTARFLQACWKLCRAYGVANIAIIHRLSDLRAQADDGTATVKLSSGLLADTETRVLFRQSTDQVRDSKELLGLTGPEAALLPRLAKGRALWKIGNQTAVVAHTITPAERKVCDTDSRMHAT
jgi:type IV secretory pathway VirB4 component